MPGIIFQMVLYSMIFYMTPRVSSANPQLQLEPEQTVYIVGEALTMRCRANNPSTVTSYSFFVDGALLSNSSSNVQQFPELTLKDAGMYFCTYSRPSFTSTESNTIQLNIVDRPNSPTISVDPESPVHFIGQKVTVHCLMESRSGVTAITLYRNGNELDGSDNFGVLTLEQITQRNAGNYSCAFSIQMNGRVIMSYQSILRPLIVTDPLQTPALSIYPRNPQKAGQRVELICRTPSPSTVSGYRFYQNGREVTEKSGIRENVFILLSFHSSLEGCYFCKTYRRVMGVEVSSSESPEQSLTEKETGGRTCNHVNQTMHDFLSPQGLKLYGSVLVGKLIVFIGVTAVFGIQLLLIKKRNQKTEIQT